MNKQNILTQIKIKNDKFETNKISNEYIFNNLLSLDKDLKYSIIHKILTDNYMNKIIIDYLFDNITLIEFNNEYSFIKKIFNYLNIYHSNITNTEWKIIKSNNNYKCEGIYDLSMKNNKNFIVLLNNIYDILKKNLTDYTIELKMYERLHGNLLIIYFDIIKN